MEVERGKRRRRIFARMKIAQKKLALQAHRPLLALKFEIPRVWWHERIVKNTCAQVKKRKRVATAATEGAKRAQFFDVASRKRKNQPSCSPIQARPAVKVPAHRDHGLACGVVAHVAVKVARAVVAAATLRGRRRRREGELALQSDLGVVVGGDGSGSVDDACWRRRIHHRRRRWLCVRDSEYNCSFRFVHAELKLAERGGLFFVSSPKRKREERERERKLEGSKKAVFFPFFFFRVRILCVGEGTRRVFFFFSPPPPPPEETERSARRAPALLE